MYASTGEEEIVPMVVNVTLPMWVTKQPKAIKTKSQVLHRYHAVMVPTVASWPEIGADSSTTWGASTRAASQKEGDQARRAGSSPRGPSADSAPGVIGS